MLHYQIKYSVDKNKYSKWLGRFCLGNIIETNSWELGKSSMSQGARRIKESDDIQEKSQEECEKKMTG